MLIANALAEAWTQIDRAASAATVSAIVYDRVHQWCGANSVTVRKIPSKGAIDPGFNSGFRDHLLFCKSSNVHYYSFRDRYAEQNYQRYDSVIRYATVQDRAFAWAEAEARYTDNPLCRRVAAEVAEAGLVNGYTAPFRLRDGSRGTISVSGIDCEIARQDPDMQRAITLLGAHACNRIIRLRAKRLNSSAMGRNRGLILDREAHDLLLEILKTSSVERIIKTRAFWSFNTSIDLHDRICCFGAQYENDEDDTSCEDDDVADDPPVFF